MEDMFRGIKNFFAYTEPRNTELGFELLEKDTEGIDREIQKPNMQQISKQHKKPQKNNEDKSNDKIKKTSLRIGKWNKARKSIEKEEKTIGSLPEQEEKLAYELEINIEYLKQRFHMSQSEFATIREFNIAKKIKACILFMDGMVDRNIINQFILPQLMHSENFENFDENNILDHIVRNVISIDQITESKSLKEIVKGTLNGDTVLLVDGCNQCLIIESVGFEKRNIGKPQTETVIKGSQEAFTEDVKTNLTLLRKIIKSENLITEIVQVGKINHANCAIIYLKGIANSDLINEVYRRVTSIDTDFIAGGGMVEQFIEDNPFMLLPQVIDTERPDRAASFLMEGKVLIITDGTPFAIAVPAVFFHLLHTSEDSSLRWQYGTFLRFIRLVGMLFALLLPGLYIALVMYHHEMIPTQLLVSIIKTEEQVPFPVIIEMFMLLLSFELIREGGIRVPSVIGNTLGIVGALILGQAAAEAGLVSPILIIIVALTGIGSFAIPSYSLSLGIRITKFIIIIFGALAGFYGVSLAMVALGLIACSMKSFGVPFLSPIAPKTKTNPDIIIRQPIWKQKMRPDILNVPNRKQQGDNVENWSNNKDGGHKK